MAVLLSDQCHVVNAVPRHTTLVCIVFVHLGSAQACVVCAMRMQLPH